MNRREIIPFLLVATVTIPGCGNQSVISSPQEKSYSASEVAIIKQSVATSVEESIKAAYELSETIPLEGSKAPETLESEDIFINDSTAESIEQSSDISDDMSSDPWENGALESIGLGDMPKPNDSYQGSLEIYNQKKHDPITGALYTHEQWEIYFSDAMYQEYENALTKYLLNKCPYSLDTGAHVTYADGSTGSDLAIIKSDFTNSDSFIHIYGNKVYFITYSSRPMISIINGDSPWNHPIYNVPDKYGPELDKAIIAYINEHP